MEKLTIYCEKCSKPIEEDQHCYQIRMGYIEDPGEFMAEEDVALLHIECLPSF